MKHCPACKTTKELDEFASNRSTKDGYAKQCKECKSSMQKAWYEKNKVRHIQNVATRRKQHKLAVVEQLIQFFIEHPCIDCGEGDPVKLDFDHMENKKMDIAKMVHHAYSWDAIMDEAKKCVVRCSNCHRLKTARERGDLRYLLSRNILVP